MIAFLFILELYSRQSAVRKFDWWTTQEDVTLFIFYCSLTLTPKTLLDLLLNWNCPSSTDKVSGFYVLCILFTGVSLHIIYCSAVFFSVAISAPTFGRRSCLCFWFVCSGPSVHRVTGERLKGDFVIGLPPILWTELHHSVYQYFSLFYWQSMSCKNWRALLAIVCLLCRALT